MSYFLKTQNIEPKKLIGIDTASPEIAAIFAENNDSCNNILRLNRHLN